MSFSAINTAVRHKLFKKIKRSYKISEETRKLLSTKRNDFLKNNPDKHPWKNKSNSLSAPCEHLKSKLKELNISFVEEYQPLENRFFSIDIAFPDKKIGIEINGNQHYEKDGKLKPYYQDRHDLIVSNGWMLKEINYSDVWNQDFLDIILKFITENIDFSTKYHKTEKTKTYCENCGKEILKNSKRCKTCSNIFNSVKNRKTERPTKEMLFEELKTMSFCAVGRKYKVSDNTIRKWVKSYELSL